MLLSDDGQAVDYTSVLGHLIFGVVKNKLFDKLTVKPNKAVKVQLPGLNTLDPVSLKIFK